MEPLIFVGFIAIFIVVLIGGIISAGKRHEAMRSLAAKLGLRFDPDKDRHLPEQYRFLDKLRRGRNRYAYNILSGSFQGHDIRVFDYHYKTGSGKNTHHHF
jgi:hypothetical protein